MAQDTPTIGDVSPQEALIALNLIEHVGPIRLRHLLQHFGGDPLAILKASVPQLLSVHGIGPETAEAIAAWESTVDLSGELQRIQDFRCTVLTQLDPEYPGPLREIYDPPPVLYIRGRLLPADLRGIALVGSRLSTPYGVETARRLAYQLAYAGVTVVSGGARGIDTAAHQGALSSGGRTIVVLGTGISQVFPAENAALFDRVAEQGAVLTQFPFNRCADRQTFPIRNRIVAGLTLGTVVVEANLNGGALITANFATGYGRMVFAVPGRIDSPRSKGCHDLIKKGAKLCEGPEDILTEFEYLFPPSNRPGMEGGTTERPALPLSEAEARVLSALDTRIERSIDQVIRSTGLPAAQVASTLFALELKRLVGQSPGKLFTRAA